jgi:ribonuclease HIII
VNVIGVDESGKGDFFGPLVIAALLAPDSDSDKLRALGARDSKLVTDSKALTSDEALRREYPHAVIVIMPAEYNQQYAKIKNLNKLLAWGHAQAISTILQTQVADMAISDKFGKTELIEGELHRLEHDIKLRQFTGGESIVQVAAASILARAEFLRQMATLSATYHLQLPKGAAAHVDAAGRQFVQLHGVQKLGQVAKLHFKNYTRVVNPLLAGF